VASLILYVVVKEIVPTLDYFIRVGVFEFLFTSVPTIEVAMEEENVDAKVVDKVVLRCDKKPNSIQCLPIDSATFGRCRGNDEGRGRRRMSSCQGGSGVLESNFLCTEKIGSQDHSKVHRHTH